VQTVAPDGIRERLSLFALSADEARPSPIAPPAIDEARARVIARDQLNGSTLLRIAVSKLRRKLSGRLGLRSSRSER